MNKINDKDLTELRRVSTYTIQGKQFIVEPVFKETGSQTLASILLRLMLSNETPESS